MGREERKGAGRRGRGSRKEEGREGGKEGGREGGGGREIVGFSCLLRAYELCFKCETSNL